MFGLVKNSIYIVLFILLSTVVINFWLNNKKYIFSEDEFIKIAKKHINPKGNINETVEAIHKDLMTRYPQHILPKEDLKFVFFSGGGWTGGICIFHASLTEFLLIFGTPMDTVGHSGRYWVNKTDVILSGELEEWKEGSFSTKIFKAGEVYRQYSGEASVVKYKANMTKLSYGRGFILSATPFMLSDVVFGNQDYASLYHIFRLHFKSLYQNLVNSIDNLNILF